jgi:hypothetical protein
MMSRALTHAPIPAHARSPRIVGATALALAAGALALAVSLGPDPVGKEHGKAGWQKTFDATSGPHVAIFAFPGVDLEPLADLPGLTAASGPFTGVDTSLRYRGREVGLRLEERPRAATVVDRPLVVSGRWVRPGTVVLERSTAGVLGVTVGDTVTAAAARGRARLTVGGIAETAVRSRNSGAGSGLGYVLPGTLARVGPAATRSSTMLLRLAEPDRAGSYLDWIRRRYPGRQVAVEEPSP